MKGLIIIVSIIGIVTLGAICILLYQNYYYTKKYQAQAEKNFREYAEEAKLLDDMAGLLEGLFDIKNPSQRRICIRCMHLKDCVCRDQLPDSQESCDRFKIK